MAWGGTTIRVGLKRSVGGGEGGKTGPLFESPPCPLLKSGLQPLGRYGTHQETINRRPEQIPPSDTRLKWLGEGLIFKLDSN